MNLENFQDYLKMNKLKKMLSLQQKTVTLTKRNVFLKVGQIVNRIAKYIPYFKIDKMN